jgi:hypothetical protein
MGQEDERRRKPAFGFMEVMLGDPGRVEPVSLRMNDLLGRQPIALARTRLIQKAGEESEPLSK